VEYVLVALLVVAVIGVAGLSYAQAGSVPEPGKPAPSVGLFTPEGRAFDVSTWKGQRVVLHFHPQDDTPECLEVLRRFVALRPAIEQAGVSLVVIGVASPEATAVYRSQNALDLQTLCDPQGRAARAYGALVNLVFMRFARKTTVLIDASGKVERAWRDIPGPQQVEALRAHLRLPEPLPV
jgi:peroxiredoxin Q/BCP